MGRRAKINIDNDTAHLSNDELERRKNNTPVYQSQEFVPPITLTSDELVVWQWLVKIFRDTKNCKVSDCDVHLMELYCRAKVATDKADSEIKEDSTYYILVDVGFDFNGAAKFAPKVNPNYRIKDSNAALCVKLFDQLGLSPLARAKAGIKGANNSDDEDIFNILKNRSD